MVPTKASRGKSPPLKRLALERVNESPILSNRGRELYFKTHKFFYSNLLLSYHNWFLHQYKENQYFKSIFHYSIILLRLVYFGRDFSLGSEGVMKYPGG